MTTRQRLKRATPFAIALGIWFSPVPAGLTAPAWHLFAVFAAAIASVLIGAFALLTASMLAVGAIVLTGTIKPEQAYSGFANSSVLLVVIAFIVAQAVVKSGLGRRVSLFMFGGPVVKDRTFFFVDYQGQRQSIGRTVTSNVPTLAERSGVFRQNIYDPATTVGNTRQQFVNNTIPTIAMSKLDVNLEEGNS